MNPKMSWVNPDHVTMVANLDPGEDELLQHEQGHFAITKIFADRLTQEFKTLRAFGLADTERDAESNAENLLVTLTNQLIKHYLNWEKAEQARYDSVGQTNHGDNDTMQRAWNVAILDGAAEISKSGQIQL